MTDQRFFAECRSLAEVSAVAALLEKMRSASPVLEDASIADRILDSFDTSPVNEARRLLLKCLLDADPADWVEFTSIRAAFLDAGLDDSTAQGALTYLSWQMKEHLTEADLAGLNKPIEALAERRRISGAIRYRLTDAGREAVAQLLG
ncbi:hypothetical protein ACQ5SO_19945 [Rhodovulum sp. DZ06]|uniref:hypothetical protein n=1 Tax=Rhodovulum sp. DZ06 TaxID=3425126 RepID=UPI003D335B08